MGSFRYFVIFAEMRTGSNLLEAALDSVAGLSCHGELFNPHFIGGPNRKDTFGLTMEQRAENPGDLLQAMVRSSKSLPGFRLFHDHDPRIIEHTISDPDCAKIILTRNPLEAYVSRKIAGATGQWRLGDLKDRRDAQIQFSDTEFSTYLSERQRFQRKLRSSLQAAGQTAFHVTYEDIQTTDTLNGLIKYLGIDAELKALPKGIKKQNPAGLQEKVANFDDMQKALSGFSWMDLEAAPLFEPERGPAVPRMVVSSSHPTIYLPIQGAPLEGLHVWMDGTDGKPATDGHTQKTLRKWLADHKDRQTFTVVTHPMKRAFHTFMTQIVLARPEQGTGLTETLAAQYGIQRPDPEKRGQVAREFLKFLEFLEGNLSGQTSLRTDPAWASQVATLEGFARFLPPDRILREETLGEDLPTLWPDNKPFVVETPDYPFALQDIVTAEHKSAIRRAYRRDFLILGY